MTVTAVVEAAARILEGEGFAGFSTNAVAERAGVSIGSLCQYFPDKEALLWALIKRKRRCCWPMRRRQYRSRQERRHLQR